VLADEINRATPKTQSALLEAMQEQQVTVQGRDARLQEAAVLRAGDAEPDRAGGHLPAARGAARPLPLGSSPRGVQGLMLAGKVRALLAGRFAVSVDDVRDAAMDVLRHRVLVSFHGQAEGITADDVVRSVLETVQAPNMS
jgi:MoxR-like ATPase